jgi:hypothetical protein
MKKVLGITSVLASVALFGASASAQVRQLPVDSYSPYNQGSGGVVMVEPRANVSGTPDAAFPYAAPHEILYVNGVPCRTISLDNGTRTPVACVRQSS